MFDRRKPPARAALATRGAWTVSLALFFEVLACSIALIGLIQGAAWWTALVGAAALLLAIPAALRSVGLSPWAALGVDVVAFALLIQLAFVPGLAIAGVVPTASSIGGVLDLFRRAVVAIQDQHIPAVALPELVFFIVLFGGVLTLVLDLLAVVLRVPAVTAVVLGGVLIVPALLQPNGLSLVSLGAGAAAWFFLLAVDGRLRRAARGGGAVALSVGASATVLALVVAATAPGFVEQGRLPVAGPVSLGNSVDPLIDLGADLRRPNPVDVLRYTTASKDPQYLQLTTLDTIRGTHWTHTPGQVSPLQGGSRLAEVPGLDSSLGISASEVTSKISVQSLRSTWVPAPYPATKVTGGGNARTYQSDDLTIFAPGGQLSGQSYTATSLDLEPTKAQLAGVGGDGAGAFADVRDDLILPGAVPAVITETADEIAARAGSSNEFDLALAIQNYFQGTEQGFVYSTDSPDTVDGGSLDVVAKFLQVRQGYCVHFASAMAVIARVLGIPSRIAIGYLPGSAIGSTGKQTTYQVDSSDLHAWPQLYFPGVGWLNFEPTVSRGSAPSYTQTTTTDPAQSATAAPEAEPSASATPTQRPRDTPSEQAAAGTGPVTARGGAQYPIGAAALLALLAIPALVRLVRRRARLARLRRGGAPPDVAWAEIRDTAQDLGFAASPTETPRAFAARLRSEWHPDATHQRDLDDILREVELSEFGPPRARQAGPGSAALAAATARVVAAMRGSRHWTTRIVAALAPRSLVNALSGRERAAMRASTYD
ncbi:hypothetical protein GCM10022288_31450 [Gryllotalpicola kribbensis]|uniref:Transglutaminase-like domain-containing protein n=1 Tax=Gryllotalpicola kribbensis TaxID=993084 RepID=A0ABP8B176_9MICO